MAPPFVFYLGWLRAKEMAKLQKELTEPLVEDELPTAPIVIAESKERATPKQPVYRVELSLADTKLLVTAVQYQRPLRKFLEPVLLGMFYGIIFTFALLTVLQYVLFAKTCFRHNEKQYCIATIENVVQHLQLHFNRTIT